MGRTATLMKDPYDFLLSGADTGALRDELIRLAEENHLTYVQDAAGNLLVRQPANHYPIKTVKVLLQGSSRQAIAFMCEAVANPPDHSPALELLVTNVNENGRSSLPYFDVKQLEARYMINLDGNNERYVISSCSGLVRLIFDTDISLIRSSFLSYLPKRPGKPAGSPYLLINRSTDHFPVRGRTLGSIGSCSGTKVRKNRT